MVYVCTDKHVKMSHEPKYIATSFIYSHKSKVLDDIFAQNKPPLFATQEVGLDQHQEDWDFDAFYVVFGKPIKVHENELVS